VLFAKGQEIGQRRWFWKRCGMGHCLLCYLSATTYTFFCTIRSSPGQYPVASPDSKYVADLATLPCRSAYICYAWAKKLNTAAIITAVLERITGSELLTTQSRSSKLVGPKMCFRSRRVRLGDDGTRRETHAYCMNVNARLHMSCVLDTQYIRPKTCCRRRNMGKGSPTTCPR
jgi:hypothetical protein